MKKSLTLQKRKTQTAVASKPVALTVKIDQEMYVRLSLLRAQKHKTAQEILTEALNAYLDRAEARK